MFPAGERGTRARSLRGPLLARLASPHDPVHGGPRLPRRVIGLVAPRRWQQTERKESGGPRRLSIPMLRLPSVPEIRYLIARLLLVPSTSFRFILAWSSWRRDHQANAAQAHYRRRPKRQPEL